MAKDKHNEDKDVVIVKKYANRRLYNKRKSCYVTLGNLAEMVRDGQDFVVYDAKINEDITRSVLAQIIFEEEAKGKNLLSANFLRQLIVLYGDRLQDVVPAYLEASMNRFLSNQEQIRTQITSAFDVNPALANFETLAQKNMEWIENTIQFFNSVVPNSVKVDEVKPKTDKGSSGHELEQLKSQLEEMQTQLSKLVSEK